MQQRSPYERRQIYLKHNKRVDSRCQDCGKQVSAKNIRCLSCAAIEGWKKRRGAAQP